MIVAGSASPLLLSSAGGYNLTKSLRFRSSASAYLNRTFGTPTDAKAQTFSLWIKRGLLGNGSAEYYLLTSGSGSTECRLVFNTNDTFTVFLNNTTYRTTTQVFRDPSSWYHIMVVLDTSNATANNRLLIYVNGVAITAFSTNATITQNATFNMFSNVAHNLCRRIATSADYLDGYLAEVYLVDGQALTPSSFGETSATTGVWIPKKYTGTYGTNGFYLPFTDVATTSGSNAGLGKDFSGNGNYWTTNNISVTSGSTYDSMTDVPTLAELSGNGNSNYCVFNPLDRGSTNFSFSNANLTVSGASASSSARATMAVSSGKWYWEATPTAIGNGLGVGFAGDSSRFNPVNWNSGTYVIYQSDGNKHINGSASSYGSSYTTNDVIGVALDMDAGTITFYKNNVSQGTALTGLSGVYLPVFSQTSGATTGTINANFGAGSGFTYTPPTGFKALNTFNLPTPTIGATASSQANKYFDATLYTGNGTSLAVTNAGSFQPDFLWIKQRSSTTSHVLQDAIRGAGKSLFSNSTAAESGNSGDLVTSFNSNGFTVNDTYLGGSGGGGTNGNSSTYVGWQWRASNATGVTNTAGSITSTVSANTTAGFSIVTYTGNGSAGATVGHGLGVAPAMVILKSRTTAYDWFVYHQSLGATKVIYLDLTDAAGTNSSYWNNTAPSSSVVTLGVNNGVNQSSQNFVAYCFAEVAGYSKFGSYTGNGSSDGPFIFTGFRPRFVLRKRTDAAWRWFTIDSSRDANNVGNSGIFPNYANAEEVSTANWGVDFLSNGFKVRSTDIESNASGGTYIYMAFAESPFKYANAR